MDSGGPLESDEEKPGIRKIVPTKELDHNEGYLKRGDGWNISLLLFLYMVQGIPLGMLDAVPIILQSRRNVKYSDQAEFSFTRLPFSMKLLWAPIIDAVYSTKFGRRKSWFIPSQMLLGSLLLLISAQVENWLGDENGTHPPNVRVLTIMFFLVVFLTATQDIALDGWAITMLQRKNLGHASTCTTIGQGVGKFLGGSVFIMLASAEFTNKYLFWLSNEPSKSRGIVSFSAYIFFWAVVIFVSTIMVGIFKTENAEGHVEKRSELGRLSVLHSYKLVWKILKLKPVQYLILILLTIEIATTISEEVFTLKLVDYDVPRDKIATLAVFNLPLIILLPIAIRGKVVGPRPMDVLKTVIPCRLMIGLLCATLAYTTPLFREGTEFSFCYYGLLSILTVLTKALYLCVYTVNTAIMARVSDPQCGATYMTILIALGNLGKLWPRSASLWLVDVFTWKKCVMECKDHTLEPCEKINTCVNFVDGYYVEVILCTIIGIIWLYFSGRTIDYLQELDYSAWLIGKRTSSDDGKFTGDERSREYDELPYSVVATEER